MNNYIKIYDLIGFKICWVMCAFSTKWGLPYLGPIITLIFILVHLIIVKFKLRGLATKKSEILGKFRRGGISSRIKYLDFLLENNKIRLNNGQNFWVVYLIFILRAVRNFNRFFK